MAMRGYAGYAVAYTSSNGRTELTTIISLVPVKDALQQRSFAPAPAAMRLRDERHRESTAGCSYRRLVPVGLRRNVPPASELSYKSRAVTAHRRRTAGNDRGAFR